MLFIVRGKNRDHDRTLRVYADSAEEAESIGFKRGLFVTEVTPVDSSGAELGKLDRIAELVNLAWKRTSSRPMRCFGRVVTNGQAAALVLCGLATWVVDLTTLVFV
jgi:hypothetical protein